METNQMNSMTDLLDVTLDDLKDLPEFKVFPAGAHRVIISWDLAKKVNDKVQVELKLKALETLELVDAAKDEPLAEGTETTMLFDLTNEFAQGNLKAIAKPLAAATGETSLRAILEASQGMECVVVTTIRHNKDKTQSYTSIKQLEVV